jgi:hypothetical protein
VYYLTDMEYAHIWIACLSEIGEVGGTRGGFRAKSRAFNASNLCRITIKDIRDYK